MRIWTRKSALIQQRTNSGKSDGVVAPRPLPVRPGQPHRASSPAESFFFYPESPAESHDSKHRLYATIALHSSRSFFFLSSPVFSQGWRMGIEKKRAGSPSAAATSEAVELNFPRRARAAGTGPRHSTDSGARSRLDRRRFARPNTHFSAFFKI